MLIIVGCNPFIARRDVLDRSNPSKPSPQIIVQKERCDLIVPVVSTTIPWTWGVSGNNSLEYSIQFTVNNGTEVFNLGFSIFNGNRNVQNGTLAELISAGQNDVWLVKGNSGTSIGSIAAKLNESVLEIALTDRTLIDRIFAAMPKSATLETGGALLVSHKWPIQIEYSLDKDGR